jgi:hypothetical protein
MPRPRGNRSYVTLESKVCRRAVSGRPQPPRIRLATASAFRPCISAAKDVDCALDDVVPLLVGQLCQTSQETALRGFKKGSIVIAGRTRPALLRRTAHHLVPRRLDSFPISPACVSDAILLLYVSSKSRCSSAASGAWTWRIRCNVRGHGMRPANRKTAKYGSLVNWNN